MRWVPGRAVSAQGRRGRRPRGCGSVEQTQPHRPDPKAGPPERIDGSGAEAVRRSWRRSGKLWYDRDQVAIPARNDGPGQSGGADHLERARGARPAGDLHGGAGRPRREAALRAGREAGIQGLPSSGGGACVSGCPLYFDQRRDRARHSGPGPSREGRRHPEPRLRRLHRRSVRRRGPHGAGRPNRTGGAEADRRHAGRSHAGDRAGQAGQPRPRHRGSGSGPCRVERILGRALVRGARHRPAAARRPPRAELRGPRAQSEADARYGARHRADDHRRLLRRRDGNDSGLAHTADWLIGHFELSVAVREGPWIWESSA